jgi:hypothetical protein
MLISRTVREQLAAEPSLKAFVEPVLVKCATFMDLGSLGPDLPYFGNLVKGFWDTFVNRTERPLGVDNWSYQLHSKDTNVFPLKLIEVAWKETNLDVEEWEKVDQQKFAFACGFLTHVAADQIVHPVVNRIAGSYYKKRFARDVHRTCEVHQDLFLLADKDGRLPKQTLAGRKYEPSFVSLPDDLWSRKAKEFRYFIQRAFVEAHAVAPTQGEVGKWIKGIRTTLKHLAPLTVLGRWMLGPYGQAYRDMFKSETLDTNSGPYKDYITLRKLNNGRDYRSYFDEAVELAIVYVRAAIKLYDADGVDAELRKKFRAVVQSADLGGPLEKDILAKAKKGLDGWADQPTG